MERMNQIIISTLFLLFLIVGTLFSGCLSKNNSSQNPTPAADVNATAIEIALNDSRLKTYLAYDGSYEIMYVGPTQYESDHSTFNVTGVEIDTPNDLYHVYVNVTNGTVDFIWSQPKRGPPPS